MAYGYALQQVAAWALAKDVFALIYEHCAPPGGVGPAIIQTAARAVLRLGACARKLMDLDTAAVAYAAAASLACGDHRIVLRAWMGDALLMSDRGRLRDADDALAWLTDAIRERASRQGASPPLVPPPSSAREFAPGTDWVAAALDAPDAASGVPPTDRYDLLLAEAWQDWATVAHRRARVERHEDPLARQHYLDQAITRNHRACQLAVLAGASGMKVARMYADLAGIAQEAGYLDFAWDVAQLVRTRARDAWSRHAALLNALAVAAARPDRAQFEDLVRELDGLSLAPEFAAEFHGIVAAGCARFGDQARAAAAWDHASDLARAHGLNELQLRIDEQRAAAAIAAASDAAAGQPLGPPAALPDDIAQIALVFAGARAFGGVGV
jgi:hypothetical protein